MAYLDQHTHSHHRATAAIGVGAIHVVIAAGLAAGLTIKAMVSDEPPPLQAGDVIIDLPPPPPKDDIEPQLTEQPQSPPQTAPQPKLDIPRPMDDVFVLPPVPIPDPPVPIPRSTGSLVPMPRATPSVAPRFDPLPAAPRNGPIGWITNNDYPGSALRREEEGTARYSLTIGANGRVEDCRITGSTGSSQLDAATCRFIERRARFDPAKDADGKAVAGTYSGQVTWQIPD